MSLVINSLKSFIWAMVQAQRFWAPSDWRHKIHTYKGFMMPRDESDLNFHVQGNP